MRRMLIIAFAILLICVGYSSAATQRLGVAPGTSLNLTKAGTPRSSGFVQAYCLDERLPAPASGSVVHQLAKGDAFVRIGSDRFPLSQAIADGKITLVSSSTAVSPFGLKIANNTQGSVEIQFRSATVFSDDPRRTVDGIDFSAITAQPEDVPLEEMQNRIWEAMFTARKESTIKAAGEARFFEELVETSTDNVQIADRRFADRRSRGLVSFVKLGPREANTLALLKTGRDTTDYELHLISEGKSAIVARGDEAILRMVTYFSTPAEFADRDRRPSELLTFVRDGDGTLVWMRTGFGQVKLVRVTDRRVATIKEGVAALDHRDEMRQRISVEKSCETGVFLHLPPLASGSQEVPFRFGETVVKFDHGQLMKFLQGDEVSRELDERLREVVEGPPIILMQDDLADQILHWRGYQNPVRVALELQRRYPQARVFLDDPDNPAQVLQRVATVKNVEGPKDVVIIHDPTKAVQDFDVFSTIEAFLRHAPLKPYPIPYANAAESRDIPESNLVILAGHKDNTFRTYVSRLSRSGIFKDKVVALFSCYERAEEAFNSRLITREGGAKAVLYFTTRIDAEAVAEILQRLSDQLDSLTTNEAGEKTDLKKLLDECIGEVLNDPNVEKRIKDEIRKMNNALFQVSHARPMVLVGETGRV